MKPITYKLPSLLRMVFAHFVLSGLLLLCCCQAAIGQPVPIKPGTDTFYIKRLIAVACKYQDEPDSALYYCRRPLELSIAGNYCYGALDMLSLTAKSYNNKGEYQLCISTNRRAVAFCSRPSEKAKFYFNIGNLYCNLGEYTLASAAFDTGLNEVRNDPTDGDPRTYFNVYTTLAVMNQRFKKDSAGLVYLLKAEHVARTHKLYKHLVIALSNKSSYYEDLGQLDSALALINEAKKIMDEHHLLNQEADVEQAIGSIYISMGMYEKAITYLKSSVDPAKLKYAIDPELTEAYSYFFLAKALYNSGKNKEAEKVLVPSMRKAASLNIQDNVIESYGLLANIYKALGQYKRAIECTDTMITLKDSLMGVEKATAIKQLQMKNQSAEKDKLLSQNELMLAQQRTKIAQKNVWILTTAGAVLLLLLVFVGRYLHTRNRQRILENEHKIGILKAAVTGGDNERSRIARELHDGVGGMLSAVMMRFSSMHHEDPSITQTAAYKEAMKILGEMGDEIRKTAHNLMPEVLLKQTLPEAVQIFCNTVTDGNGLKINFQSYGDYEDLPQSHKLNLYRIIQELIKNTLIHANAKTIMVQLLRNADKLVVSVEDDGAGFNVNEVNAGLGLHNMRTRVSSMDGQLTIESRPGSGTTVIIEFEQYETMIRGDIHKEQGGQLRA